MNTVTERNLLLLLVYREYGSNIRLQQKKGNMSVALDNACDLLSY